MQAASLLWRSHYELNVLRVSKVYFTSANHFPFTKIGIKKRPHVRLYKAKQHLIMFNLGKSNKESESFR